MAQTRTDLFLPAQGGPERGNEDLRLSNYLGILREDPDDVQAQMGLSELVVGGDTERLGAHPVRLLEAARAGHEQRGEWSAVATLLRAEATLAAEEPALRRSLLKELGRVRTEYLLDDQGAQAAFEEALALGEDKESESALRRIEESRANWKQITKRFVAEADDTTDTALRTSLMLRAARLLWQYKKKGRIKEVEALLDQVLSLDPGNLRAVQLYEHTLREREQWKKLADKLIEVADDVSEDGPRTAAYLHAARICERHLSDTRRAVACYERVLDLEPGDTETLGFLAKYFTDNEQWDHLAGLYEDALRTRQKLEVEQALLLQISMVHWRMRERPDAAEPYFMRLRKLEPAHFAVLDFAREYYTGEEHADTLLSILSDAQKATEDPALRLSLAEEMAQVLQDQAGQGDRAIEAWKLVLRMDPTHATASSVLKELYAKSNKWNALVEVLRNEVDALPEEEKERKVELLRELAEIYREYLRMDGMVVNTYNAILKVLPGDRRTLDELAARYRAMGRYNDLIALLSQEADARTDADERVDLYLEVARLWVEHFSNYNQATVALEHVVELRPGNQTALRQLKEIYERKRAWNPLYDVLRREREATEDPAVRNDNAEQMARLLSDRLHRNGEAIVLWREVIAESGSVEAFEAAEKLADREKDYPALGEILEERLAAGAEGEEQLRLLQKLGSLYADRLNDSERAKSVFQRMLALDPKNGRALRSLRDTYVAEGDWDALSSQYREVGDFEGLVEVLNAEAERTEDPKLKVDLSFRAAKVFCEDIADEHRSLRSYERILAVEPHNMEAAQAVLPIYEREEKHARAVAVLERMLEATPDEHREARLGLLTRLSKLSSERLRDAEAAFKYAATAFKGAPDDEAAQGLVESTATAAAAHDRLARVYQEVAETLPEEQAVALHRRIGELLTERLGDLAGAADQYRAVLKALPGDQEALLALERVERAQGDMKGVSDVLTRRLAVEEDATVRADLLRELAELQETHQENPDAAARSLRELSELEPDNDAVLADLDRLAVAGERKEEQEALLVRRLEICSDDSTRVELGSRLGQLRKESGRLSEAFDAYVGVLREDPSHAQSLAALDAMLDSEDVSTLAVLSTLEDAHERAGRYDKLAGVLARRMREVDDADEVQRLRLRIAEINRSQLGDAAGAYGALEEAFLEQPSDATLWDRLAEAAQEANQLPALAQAYDLAIKAGEGLSESDQLELSRKAAKLHGEQLFSPEDAEPFHKRVLALEPLDDPAFAALRKLYTEQERWEDLLSLYGTRIEEVVDAQTKVDLLLQCGFLQQELLERPEQAIEAYRGVRELVPGHVPTTRALSRLLEQTGRFRDLSELLQENIDHADGPDQVDLRFRLGELFEHKLSEPGRAVDQYEAILLQQPTHLRSQQALSRLLVIESTRGRVAAILEPIYESQGAYQELASVLEIQLESMAADDMERIGRLMQLGELYEQRLRDAESAFGAFARAAEADPADEEARQGLRRVSHGRDALRRRRAQLLSRLLEKAEGDNMVVASLLRELAQLLDEYLEDSEGAERAYERLIALDDQDAEQVMFAARALERIHMAREDHQALAHDLERQLAFESDALEQRDLLSRLAILYQDVLDNSERAIEVNRQRLELEPADRDAAERLTGLLRQAEKHAELVEVLRARAPYEEDASAQRALLQEACQVLEEKVDDAPAAIDAYQELLVAYGPDATTLSALSALYDRTGAYPELVDVLQQRESLAESEAEALDFRLRIAAVTDRQLGDKYAAIDLYESVLEQQPEHSQALSALMTLTSDEEPAVALAAARVAIPRLEAAGEHERLLAALQVQAEHGDTATAIESLRKAATVAHEGLGQSGQGYEYLARAILLDPGEPELPDMLHKLQALAEDSGRLRDFSELLQKLSPEISDGSVRVSVQRTLATLARDQLSDTALARQAFTTLLELEPTDRDALLALEQLTSEAGDHAALLDVLGRRAELESDGASRAALLLRKAELHERLDEGPQAIEVLEDVLLEAPNNEAFAALQRLYAAAGRFEDEVGVYERQLDLNAGNPVALRHSIAKVCVEKLDDPARALSYLRDAVIDDPSHAGSRALLEQVMASPSELRAVAAEILEPGYLGAMEWEKLTGALEAQLEVQDDLDERKRLLVRLSQIYEDQLEDFEGTFAVYARLFREDPCDEHVWDRLSRLARVDGKWGQLAEVLTSAFDDGPIDDPIMASLAKFTGNVLEQRVSDLRGAAGMYDKALTFDRTDLEAFKALESVYLRLPDLEALIEVYQRQADEAGADDLRIELLHKRARLLADRLERPQDAIEAYRDLLSIHPGDEVAAEALDQLLAQVGDTQGLAEHLRFRAEQAVGTDQAVLFRLRLSTLLREQLDDLPGAIDILEDICMEHQGQPDAVATLEELVQGEEYRLRITEILEPAYRYLDQWMKLVAILEAQVELREDRDEQVRLLSEIAGLHETRGGDGSLAFDALGRALVIDPDNEHVRAEVDRLATSLGCWDTLIAVYEAALANATDKATRAHLLATIARVQDERLGDPRAAIVAYEQLFKEEPEEFALLDSLDGLYTLVSDWPGLVSVIERKVELSFDVVERGDLLRRMATVQEDLMGERDKAIATYRRATEEDPSDTAAFEALDRLFTESSQPEPLGEVLVRRLELALSPSQRVEIGLRLGALQQHHLHRMEEAIESYRGVLSDDERNSVAIAELASLFEARAMWPELLDNLSHQVSLAGSKQERVELHCRMAQLLLTRLHDATEAVEQYREALQEEPSNETAIGELMELAEQEDLRERAGEVLRPLLLEQGRFDELVRVHELGLQDVSDPLDRREHLLGIAHLHEEGRQNPAAAYDAYARALAEDPGSQVVQDQLERVAATEGLQAKLAPLFVERAEDVPEPRESSLLFKRAGRIFEEDLQDSASAIDAYRKAAARDDDDLSTLERLDRLYTQTEAWEELLQILDRRVAATGDVDERAALLLRLGALRMEHFNDAHGALVAYREVLELLPNDPQALAGLEALGERPEVASEVVELLDDAYRQLGALDKVIGLYELRARLAPTDDEKVQVLREAAVIWERDLGDPARAITTLNKALEVDPNEEDLLVEIERMAQDHGLFQELQGLVEHVLENDKLDVSRSVDLCMRAARWHREYLSDLQGEENMLRRVVQERPDLIEVHERLVELARDPGREADLVASLCAASRADTDPVMYRERLKEAARVAEQALADQSTAADCLEQVLASDPEDLASLDEVVRLRSAMGDHAALASAMARRIKLTDDPEEQVERKHALAELYCGPLEETEEAIGVYRQILADRPDDRKASAALEELLSQVGRYDELSGLLEQRLASTEDGDERSAIRVRMASLREQRFGDTDGAIEQLRSILAEQPDHDAALTELERLYTTSERYPELSLLLARRIEQARVAVDPGAEEAFLRRLSVLYETHLRDQDNARHTYERLSDLVPDDPTILRRLVRLYASAEMFPELASGLQRLIPLEDGEGVVEANLTLAEVATRHLGDDGMAIDALQAALQVDPARDDVRARLLERYEVAQRYEDVIVLLQQDVDAASSETDKVALLKRIAQLCIDQLGQPERAVGYLEQASALVPDEREVLLLLCDIYIAAGRQADAIPTLEQIIASYGGRRAKEVAVYHHRLGRAYEGNGDLEKAFEHYDAAFKIDLTNVAILSDLGRVCMERGDLERALKTYRALLLQRLGPDSGIQKSEVYFKLGQITQQQGDPQRAKAMYQRAVSEGGHEGAAAALAELS